MDRSDERTGPAQPPSGREQPAAPETTSTSSGAEGPGGTPPALTRRYGVPAFVVVFLVAFVLFIITIASTLAPILLGAILAVVAQPLHRRMLRRLHGGNLTAAIMTVLIVAAVLLPLGALLWVLVQRLATALSELSTQGWFHAARWQSLLAKYPTIRRLLPPNLGSQVSAALKFVAAALPSVVAGIASRLVALFLTIIATYYFLRDAEWIFVRLERALPLEPRHTRAIADEFKRVGRAVIFGTIGTALLQGTAAGIAYWAVGLHQSLLLGALTVIAALVPVVGTALVMVPATVYLAISGETLRAVLLLGAGLLVVGLIDNLVRPMLNRLGLEIHPLLAFLGIFGGLASFGFSGIYLGPLLVALFLAVVRIYESEVAPAAAAPVSETAPEQRLGRALSQALSRSLRRRR